MSDRPFTFVLMPFSEDFNDLYELGVKPACELAGTDCERADEQFFNGYILDQVYHQISTADFVVAVMTGRNPNVFYETGFAHARGKVVILITAEEGEIPFDLKIYPHIIYGNRIAQLKQELTDKLSSYVDDPWKLHGMGKTIQSEFYVHLQTEDEHSISFGCQCFEEQDQRWRPSGAPVWFVRTSQDSWRIDVSEIRSNLGKPSSPFKFFCDVPQQYQEAYLGRLCLSGYVVTGFGDRSPDREGYWRIWFLHGDGQIHRDVQDVPRLNHQLV